MHLTLSFHLDLCAVWFDVIQSVSISANILRNPRFFKEASLLEYWEHLVNCLDHFLRHQNLYVLCRFIIPYQDKELIIDEPVHNFSLTMWVKELFRWSSSYRGPLTVRSALWISCALVRSHLCLTLPNSLAFVVLISVQEARGYTFNWLITTLNSHPRGKPQG